MWHIREEQRWDGRLGVNYLMFDKMPFFKPFRITMSLKKKRIALALKWFMVEIFWRGQPDSS